MFYAFLADLIVVVHFAYMAFVVVGQFLIVAGIPCRWGWIRNLRFRLAHLAAIVVVALEAVLGIVCPLTRWEYDLRLSAGQNPDEGSFVGRWVHNLLFYDLPPWVFTCAYVAFAVLVVATFLLAPPRRRNPAI